MPPQEWQPHPHYQMPGSSPVLHTCCAPAKGRHRFNSCPSETHHTLQSPAKRASGMELGTADRKGTNQDKTRNIPLPLEGRANPFCQSQEKNVHHLNRICIFLQAGFIPALLSLPGRSQGYQEKSPCCSIPTLLLGAAPPFVSLL